MDLTYIVYPYQFVSFTHVRFLWSFSTVHRLHRGRFCKCIMVWNAIPLNTIILRSLCEWTVDVYIYSLPYSCPILEYLPLKISEVLFYIMWVSWHSSFLMQSKLLIKSFKKKKLLIKQMEKRTGFALPHSNYWKCWSIETPHWSCMHRRS